MKGNNRLVLNTATMIEIVQYWLNNKLLNADEPRPTVTAVAPLSSSGRYADDGMFEVSLSTDEEKA